MRRVHRHKINAAQASSGTNIVQKGFAPYRKREEEHDARAQQRIQAMRSSKQPGHGGDGGGDGDGKPKRAQMSYNALMQVSCLEVVFFSLLTLILMVGGVVLGLHYSMILGWSLFGFGTLVALFLLGTFTVGKFQMHKQRAMYAKMAAKEPEFYHLDIKDFPADPVMQRGVIDLVYHGPQECPCCRKMRELDDNGIPTDHNELLRQVSLPGNTDPEKEDEEGRGGDDDGEKYASNIKLNSRNRMDEGAMPPPMVTHTLIQTITHEIPLFSANEEDDDDELTSNSVDPLASHRTSIVSKDIDTESTYDTVNPMFHLQDSIIPSSIVLNEKSFTEDRDFDSKYQQSTPELVLTTATGDFHGDGGNKNRNGTATKRVRRMIDGVLIIDQ